MKLGLNLWGKEKRKKKKQKKENKQRGVGGWGGVRKIWCDEKYFVLVCC